MENKKGVGFWILVMATVVLVVFLIIGQTLSLIDYDLALSLGLQESEKEIGKVGIAFAKGFAFGDTISLYSCLEFWGYLKEKNGVQF